MTPLEILELVLLGLTAGVLGGLLGIGGSVIMIPALMLLLGKNQHMAAAAAMIINAAIAFPAMIRHQRARAVRWDVVGRMLPAALICIIIGVESSNAVNLVVLRTVFGGFLLYVIWMNILKLSGHHDEPPASEHRTGWFLTSFVGGIIGFIAGLLGIGGGAIGVPLQQRVLNLPLRQCIGSMSALMCVTAVVGAIRKNMTLGDIEVDGLPMNVLDSLQIAAVLLPTAMLGGLFGASLTHSLPLRTIRVAFILLLVLAAIRMLGLDSLIWDAV